MIEIDFIHSENPVVLEQAPHLPDREHGREFAGCKFM
jgi:hypothetical protein